jgi:hypothetical protein
MIKNRERGVMDKPNIEYHEMIDDLTERKFFGSLTLHFQAGIIDHSMTTERNTAKEIKEKMNAKKGCESLHITKRRRI